MFSVFHSVSSKGGCCRFPGLRILPHTIPLLVTAPSYGAVSNLPTPGGGAKEIFQYMPSSTVQADGPDAAKFPMFRPLQGLTKPSWR